MKDHKDFVAELILEAAPQDVSTPILQKLLRQGYDLTTWRTSASAMDAPCISKDGDQLALRDFLGGLRHNAPMFEKTHVGCRCIVEVTSTKNRAKKMIRVSAFGIAK